MSKKYYLVQQIMKSRMTNVGSEIDFSWEDGMAGVMPVFTNKRKAEKYADGKEVLTFEAEQ